MIMQVINIIGGADGVASSLLTQTTNPTHERLRQLFATYKSILGLIMLAAGVIALISRFGFLPFYIPSFGESFPQAIPAILLGLVFSEGKLSHIAPLANIISILKPHEQKLAILCFISGLGSILFGCVLCTFV